LVDGVTATARSAAFERTKLSDETQSSMAFGIVAIAGATLRRFRYQFAQSSFRQCPADQIRSRVSSN
jgi:hypothetical protein